MFKSVFRRIVGAFVAAAGLVFLPQAAEAKSAPALWSVSDADTTVYLFGTIHLLPDNYQWRTAKFDQAVAGSNELVLETIVDDKDPMKLAAVLARLGFSGNLPPIASRIAPAKVPKLEAAIAKTGIPRSAFDNMESWTAAFMLLGNQFKDLGLKSDQGVEMNLRTSFASQGKPVGELETNAEQLGFFDTLPEPAQRALLEGAVEDPSAMREAFKGMLAAWSRGDVKAIGRSFNRDLAASPELKAALLDRRNANWSRWIEQRMAKPGSVLIAVGAGHLAGPDSVLELLKRDGYKVQRVQ